MTSKITAIASTSKSLVNYFLKISINLALTSTSPLQLDKNYSNYQETLLHTANANYIEATRVDQPHLLNILELWATISHSLWFVHCYYY